MGATRAQVYPALFALGQSISWTSPGASGPRTWATTSRRPLLPDDVGDQPAFCQAEYLESTLQTTRLPQRRIWEAAWMFYLYVGDAIEAVPADSVNAILDQVDLLFPADQERPGAFRQTLGGLVHKVWIEGRTEKYGGNIDPQMLVVVPLKILVP